ncbi:MAG: fumarylacetoacetate hydrolase family protein [Deltaproteobacteria bacterium]|jgi:2-keto-4-pentenoate hydratase/2-oxohepta-3-ene-1,7-dioic acid hydratase in catechol pathway|nr:fumarylacetoacetate hydrolase family protein [Deltaproteobacteria bacterium]
MKLIRFGTPGKEKPGVLLADGTRKDLSAHFKDWDRDFFNNNGLEQLSKRLLEGQDFPDVSAQERLGSCVERPGKVVCIGLNYADHAAEAGMPLPTEPIVFLKGSNTVVGPYDPIIIPRTSTKTDWEVELGVIIGRDARYLPSVTAAADYIAGYCLSNDVSEREFQLERGGQWTKGKSCDNFNPLGPFLATRDELIDVNNLQMKLWVNGELRQDGNSATMVFDVMTVVHYLSQFMTLEAGDLITTGTPPGVGMGMKPPRYLRAGDVVELEIPGLGSQRSLCIAG